MQLKWCFRRLQPEAVQGVKVGQVTGGQMDLGFAFFALSVPDLGQEELTKFLLRNGTRRNSEGVGVGIQT